MGYLQNYINMCCKGVIINLLNPLLTNPELSRERCLILAADGVAIGEGVQ